MRRKSTVLGVVLLAAGVALLVAMSVLWGLGVWGPRAGVSDGQGDELSGPIDRHFIEQMIPHHENAVAMSELALDQAEHPELKELAQTIIRDQTREIEQMQAWYLAWYGIDAPTYDESSPGTGRGGGMMDGGMMGGGMMGGGMMNDEADLEVLAAAAEFDKEFIEQMIPHHQMGVMMARMVLARTDRPEIEQLARSIITSQTAEIEQMQDWYDTWY